MSTRKLISDRAWRKCYKRLTIGERFPIYVKICTKEQLTEALDYAYELRRHDLIDSLTEEGAKPRKPVPLHTIYKLIYPYPLQRDEVMFYLDRGVVAFPTKMANNSEMNRQYNKFFKMIVHIVTEDDEPLLMQLIEKGGLTPTVCIYALLDECFRLHDNVTNMDRMRKYWTKMLDLGGSIYGPYDVSIYQEMWGRSMRPYEVPLECEMVRYRYREADFQRSLAILFDEFDFDPTHLIMPGEPAYQRIWMNHNRIYLQTRLYRAEIMKRMGTMGLDLPMSWFEQLSIYIADQI